MPDTATVTVTVRGVRLDQLPRLNTALKSYVQRFGSGIDVAVVDDQPKPADPKPADPKPAKQEKPATERRKFGRR